MNRLIMILAAVAVALSTPACSKPSTDIPDWPWDDPDPKEDPADPGKDDPDGPDVPGGDDTPDFKGKPRYVWIDASANFRYFANSEENIAADLKKVKEAGFTDVIVDVRPTEGDVLFDSKVAPHATKLAAWVDGQYKFVKRTASFDYLKAFCDAGHELGLRVNAAMNTFVGGYGGYYGLESVGPIFSGDIPRSWATVINSEDGIQSSFHDGVGGTVFLNPASDEVQEYLLKIIAEIAAYDVDGIILDRCRYDDSGLQCEFSDISRSKFEQYLGRTVKNWPDDIFPAGTSSLPKVISATQKSWLSFRAKVIHDFVEKASNTVHSVNPEVRFGCYVGAWYSSYYSSGVNWASPKFKTSAKFSWADTDYANYGYADHCDFMMLGCYAGTSSVYGNNEWTMQGFAKKGREYLCGDTVFAGGPDVGNSTGFEKGGAADVIPSTIDACINEADGYFVFDLCHIRMYDYWAAFRKGFDNYLNTL